MSSTDLPRDARKTWALLALALLIGLVLRLNGIDWGTAPDGTFHAFHPDETTIVRHAHWVGSDLRQIEMPYGYFPSYLLWGAAGLTGVDIAPPLDEPRPAYLLARWLTLVFSMGTLAAVFALGLRVEGPRTGVLATLLMALCYGHIQQSHYYTVDPLLTGLATLCLLAIVRMPQAGTIWYLVGGVAAGLATGTRLIGVLLFVPFALQHLWSLGIRGLLTWRVFLFLGAMGVVTLLCEPYALLDPAWFFSEHAVLTWRKSLEISVGDALYIWSLYDFGTTPFLFHLTDTLPYSLGLPLLLAGAAGIVLAARHRHQALLVLLSFGILYFVAVAGHHLKPVRYMAPLLPLLVVLGAWVCVSLWRSGRYRRLSRTAAALIVVPSVALGLGSWNLYSGTDARIEAARWIEDHIPHDATVLVEQGGFPSSRLVSQPDQRHVEASTIIRIPTCVSEAAQIRYLRLRIVGAEWFVLIEENRQRHFLAAREEYPVGYGLYERLLDGRLGYTPVTRFVNRPGVGPLTWERPYDEPTMTAFDAPTVVVYRSQGDDVNDALLAWEKERAAHDDEQALASAAQRINEGNLAGARDALRPYRQRYPDTQIGQILSRAANGGTGKVVIDGYTACNCASLQQLMDLGLPTTAGLMAEQFVESARRSGSMQHFIATTRFAAGIALETGDFEQAARHYDDVRALVPDEKGAHTGFALACARLGRTQEARRALQRVLELDADDPYARNWLRALGE